MWRGVSCPSNQELMPLPPPLPLPATGTFLEGAAQSPEALPLAAAVVELVRSPRVHTHPEPFVRRAALLATSQVGCQVCMACGVVQGSAMFDRAALAAGLRSAPIPLLRPNCLATFCAKPTLRTLRTLCRS